MKQEENVCEGKVPETERAAGAEGKKGSAVLGKFKSTDALAEAYSALQAEFTRRSQRLRELEKRAENPEGPTAAAAVPEAEKPHAERTAEKTEAGRSEGPCAPTVRGPGPDSYTEGEGPALPQTPPEGEFRDKAETSAAMTEDELYRAASRSEAVRLKIVGDYLLSLKNAEAPLMRGGTGTLAAPPLKARTIADAGDMALRFFKREGQA